MDWGFGGLEGKWETRRTLVLSLCFSIRLKRRVLLGQMGGGTSMFEPVLRKCPLPASSIHFAGTKFSSRNSRPDGVMQSVGSGRSKWAHQCAEARGTLGQYNSKGFSCQLVPFWSPLTPYFRLDFFCGPSGVFAHLCFRCHFLLVSFWDHLRWVG